MTEEKYNTLYREIRPFLYYKDERRKIAMGILWYLASARKISKLSEVLDELVEKTVEQYKTDFNKGNLETENYTTCNELSSFRHGIHVIGIDCSEELSTLQRKILATFRLLREWATDL